MRICYYVTSHGLGHSIRACTVCEHMPAGVELHFRTGVAERLFREELARSFTWNEASFDCGCIQRDSVTVDVAATVRRYREIAVRNKENFAAEVAWLREKRFDAVVSDIPSFPLAAARAAGISGIAVANFTWHDVYAEYEKEYAEVGETLNELVREYASADLLVEAAPALPMPYFRHRVSVGVIGRTGADIRKRLEHELGIASDARLALIYVGTFGMQLPWERLEQFSGWFFLSSEPLPGAASNCRVFDPLRFRYRDVAASVDLVVSKLGYCTVTSCMANRVPLLYLPRWMFAEHAALEAAVKEWGWGYRLEEEPFRKLEWGDTLEQVALRGRPEKPVGREGARRAAEEIVRFVRERKG